MSSSFTDNVETEESVAKQGVVEPDINMIEVALNKMSLEDCQKSELKVEVEDNKVYCQTDNLVIKPKNSLKIDFTKTDFTSIEKEFIRKEVDVIKEKYPKYIPVIIRPKDKGIKLLRYKFLVNGDITVGQFMCIIRKKIQNIKSSEALFLIVNNSLAPSAHLLSLVYKQQVDKETNMLFFTLCNENTFGKN